MTCSQDSADNILYGLIPAAGCKRPLTSEIIVAEEQAGTGNLIPLLELLEAGQLPKDYARPVFTDIVDTLVIAMSDSAAAVSKLGQVRMLLTRARRHLRQLDVSMKPLARSLSFFELRQGMLAWFLRDKIDKLIDDGLLDTESHGINILEGLIPGLLDCVPDTFSLALEQQAPDDPDTLDALSRAITWPAVIAALDKEYSLIAQAHARASAGESGVEALRRLYQTEAKPI